MHSQALSKTVLRMHLQERRQTRLYVRPDDYGRFLSCLVYLPRDGYTTAVRLKIESILKETFGGISVEFTTRVSDRVGGIDGDQVVSSNELQGNFTSLDRLNLIKVIVSYSGPADRLSFDTLNLRSQPPLPQERRARAPSANRRPLL